MEENLKTRVCAVIPAYNEAKTISGVIRRIRGLGIDAVVVNDGSQDETSLSVTNEGAILIQHRARLGKGASLKDGFEYALSNGYEFIIAIDADGQHDPFEIPLFIKKAKDTGAGIVVGNRMGNPIGMPLTRIFTNRLMSAIVSAICRQKIPDTQCGYRLFSRDALSSIDIEAHKFEIDSELLIKLSKKGYRIESIPIKSIYEGEKSQINPLTDTIRFILFLIKILREG